MLLFSILLPTLIPWYFWDENLTNSFFVNMFRYGTMLNFTFLVNSAAHKWGSKPYDKSIMAVQNLLVGLLVIGKIKPHRCKSSCMWLYFTLTLLGEGFHNYHHVFPQDYATSEFGTRLNFTTAFIDFMAHLGQAYDLKTAEKSLIASRKARTGFHSD